MSHLLGIYCKTVKITEINYSSVLKIFSIEGKRPFISSSSEKYIVFHTNWNPSDSIKNPTFIDENQINHLSETGIDEPFNLLNLDHKEFLRVRYNEKEHTLQLANNALGISTLFFCETENCLFFCTEIEPLTKIPGIDLSLDINSIAEYFQLGSVLGSKTFFKNIRNMEPGTILSFNGNKREIKKYSTTEIPVDHSRSVESFAEEAANLLRQSVNRRITKATQCKIMLTGGIDTRLILSCIPKELRGHFPFVTYLTPPLTEDEDQEVLIAKHIAQDLGLQHSIEEFPYLGRQFGPWYFEEQHNLTGPPLVGGLFGSEIFKGEFIFSMPGLILQRLKNNWNMEIPSRLMQQVIANEDSKDYPEFIDTKFGKDMINPFISLESYVNSLEVENKELLFALQTLLRSFFTNNWGQSTYSLPFIQPAVTMSNTILPFTDTDFLKFLLRVPPQLLGINPSQLYGVMYRNHFPELCKYPTNSAYGKNDGNCIPFIREGKPPQEYRKVHYQKTFETFAMDDHVWERGLFNKKVILKYAQEADGRWMKKFVEVESWLQYINQK